MNKSEINKPEIIEEYIRNKAKENPSIFTEELIQQAIKEYKDDADDLSIIKQKIDTISSKFIERKLSEQKYLQSMQQKYKNSEYINTSILNIDISTIGYDQMEQLFFHYGWNKYLESYDKYGMKPTIGENSEGIDPEASIFFSKGIEGVLELWDVWLKWRLNRLNNPQFKGNTHEEIELTKKRFETGKISDEERNEWYYWIDYFKNKEYLKNPLMLEKLYEYQYNEMINSDYFIMDLRENEEFIYDQIDIKKQLAIEKAKTTGRGIDPLTSTQYGSYSDFSTAVVDKWNMQTIPGKDMTIEPSRIRRLTIDGKTDVFSIIKYMYDRYQIEVPKEKQVKFDILDNYIKYIIDNKKEEKQQIYVQQSQIEKEAPKKDSQPKFMLDFEKKENERKTDKETKTVNPPVENKIEHENMKNKTNEHNMENLSNEKKLVLTKKDNNKSNNAKNTSNGFASVVTLALTTGFVAGMISMLIYYICK